MQGKQCSHKCKHEAIEEAFYMLLPANKSDRMCHLVAITHYMSI